MSVEDQGTVVPDAHQPLNNQFQRLFRDGRLVQVHISKWCMSARLNAEDLPLVTDAQIPEFVKLGEKRLIDEQELKKFACLENTARGYLRANSFLFPIAQAHFVPNKTLLAVMEKLDGYRVKYEQAVNEFVQGYEQHKQNMLAKYPGQQHLLLPYYPSAEQIRSKFGFRVGVFAVAFPEQMREIDLASIEAEAEARAEMSRKFQTEWQRQYENSMAEVNGFLKDAVAASRGRVVEVFETIAEKIRNREVITVKTLRTMSSIIKAFDGLDFLDDKALREQLASVKELISSGRDFKEDEEAIHVLTTAVGQVLDVARATTDLDAITGDYIRKVEL